MSLTCERHPDRVSEVLCALCCMPLCLDCRIDGAEGAACCAEHRALLRDWRQIATGAEWAELESLRANLRIGGIDTMMFSLHDHASGAFSVEGETRLFVREQALTRSEELLRELNLLPVSLPRSMETGQ